MQSVNFIYPSFMIIGAQKAGTSGLFYSLADHPQLLAPGKKEIYYFCDDGLYDPVNHSAYNRNFFRRVTGSAAMLSYEATPEYSYHPHCARRIYEYNPDMKVIYLVRNPVKRAYAAWQMYCNFRDDPVYSGLYDKRTFDHAISDEMDSIDETTFYSNSYGYIKRGHYSEELQRYLDIFPVRNILVLGQEELTRDWDSCISRVEHFLGVDQVRLVFRKINPTQYLLSDKENQFQELRRFFLPWNEEFFLLSGRRFEWR